MAVKARSYCSPTLVLLAFDWPEGATRADFLGFAIKRAPGFGTHSSSWLPNRIDFDGPDPNEADKPSNQAPIQKFMWWDARIDTEDRGKLFTYRVIPMTGTPSTLKEEQGQALDLPVTIPHLVENGTGIYFNRAVISSQAFARHFPSLATNAALTAAQAWLANGMQAAVLDFLAAAHGKSIAGAIYHLTDDVWTVPALSAFAKGKLSLVYHQKSDDHESEAAIMALEAAGHPKKNFVARTHSGQFMHDKFLVRRGAGDHAEAVLTGSANFTIPGLCVQANVLHTFESSSLATLYLARQHLLATDPTLKNTATANTGWSAPIGLAGGQARVFFPPEPKTARVSLDTIVNAVRAGDSSVIFCCFTPTDLPILNACFEAGDEGRMMFGLVNSVELPSPGDVSYDSKIELYHRSQDKRDVVGKGGFTAALTPLGFLQEPASVPFADPFGVRIHHKFVLIDAETDTPVLYTGSANLSNNSAHQNDENLLEIVGSPRLAHAYLAEFLRLYEHYRARLFFERFKSGDFETFKLTPNASWAKKYYKPGSPEARARVAMVGG